MIRIPFWKPSQKNIESSNIFKMMDRLGLKYYTDFWKWSVKQKGLFWKETIDSLDIQFEQKYSSILDTSKGVKNAKWLVDAKLNIVDSCFQNDDDATAIIFQTEENKIQKISQKELLQLVNKIANGLKKSGLKEGDKIAIIMPMTVEAIAIYLAGIKAGMPVVTIADSFTSNEITVRIKITNPKIIFTQDILKRLEKELPLYSKVIDANPPKTVVFKTKNTIDKFREIDILWNDFLSENTECKSVIQNPDDIITILFSSGTTGEPKAIPWTQTTPIKSVSDAYYHQNIQKNDVVCWPTNLGWMMGPWLVFSALINKASIALFYGSPTDEKFGEFVQNTKITMLGVVPSFVNNWKGTKYMEKYDWNSIKCFSSTGEVSNPNDMEYLMNLANNKPVIEYCGGTEIGGGYIASTVVQPNIASAFSTQTLGGEFILLNEKSELSNRGEIFIIPPIIGLSESLINRNHFDVYYKDTPKYKNIFLRRHGDQLEQLKNGYYIAQGRVDDAMNLGGIKVSSVQIEKIISKLDFIDEVAAIAVPPEGGGPNVLVIYYVEKINTLSSNEKYNKVKNCVKTQLNPLFKVSELIKIDSLPRTASNKIMRRKLREFYENK